MVDPSGSSDIDIRYLEADTGEKEELIRRLKKELRDVGGVIFAYVHGGFVEMDRFRDVDVAVWIEDHEEAFRYEVDVSVELEVSLKAPMDLRVLNGAPLPFRYHVFSEGRLLFSEDEELRVDLVDETVREYSDLRMLREYAG